MSFSLLRSLKSTLSDKSSQLDDDLQRFAEILDRVAELQNQISGLIERIGDLEIFDEDQQRVERELNELAATVHATADTSQAFVRDTQDKYLKQQGFVPLDIAQELKSLELAAEAMQSAMTDREREHKRARTVRTEYLSNVDYIQTWLTQAELRIQDRTQDPHRLKDMIGEVQKELATVLEKLDTVKQCAVVIVDKSRSDDEKRLVQGTVDQLVKQVDQFRNDLDEKKHLTNNSLDACTRFMKLYGAVMKWAAEKREFIAASLEVTTLSECRQKMNEYAVIAKAIHSNLGNFQWKLPDFFSRFENENERICSFSTRILPATFMNLPTFLHFLPLHTLRDRTQNAAQSIKPIAKNISEMDKELDAIAQVTSTGELRGKLLEADEAKVEIEAILLKRVK